jgi:N-acetylglucosamine kinase-like BadF-type ATPase
MTLSGSQAELVLAVDGGGTKTQAVLVDGEGNVVGRGLGPGCNLHKVGFEECCKAVTTAVEGALEHVVGGRARGAHEPVWRFVPIAAACFGLAGIDSPEDEAEVSAWVRQQEIATSFQVYNDSELILAAGTPEGWGVALISGTGSVCLGRSPEGRELRVGGWGSLLGDEGSGYGIAVRALHLVTQTADGRADATDLLKAVLHHWSLADAPALIRHVYAPTMTHSELAGLATTVLNLSSTGDPAAKIIVDEAARDLALHVDTVIRKLGLKRPPLAVAGGVLRAQLRKALQGAIQSELAVINHVADPCMGAVTIARRLLQGAGHHR